MTIKHIKGITLALAMLATTAVVKANDRNEEEREITSILTEELNREAEQLREIEQIASDGKIYVLDLDGKLVFAAEENELLPEHYKVLFQSDLVMETLGSKYYVKID